MQGAESPRRSRLLRGFCNAADAQKLAHPEKMYKNKKNWRIIIKALIFFRL
jgi:hypothetical protein